MIEGMRSPSESEMEHIVDVCENYPKPLFFRKKWLFLLLYLGFSIFAFVYSYVTQKDLMIALCVGVVIYLLTIGTTLAILLPYIRGIKRIPALLESGEMLVLDAVFNKTSRKYLTSYVTISDRGKTKSVGMNLTHMETLESGDPVLIIKQGGSRWAFKNV